MAEKELWAIVVYNDDVHQLDEVIDAFKASMEVPDEVAQVWASAIHQTGLCPIGIFEYEKAQRIAQSIRSLTCKANCEKAPAGLQVEIDNEAGKAITERMGKALEGPIAPSTMLPPEFFQENQSNGPLPPKEEGDGFLEFGDWRGDSSDEDPLN